MRSVALKLYNLKLLRYLFAGGTGASVHIGTVYFLTHHLNVWYVYATTAGFVAAFFVSFTLQKFFTFRDVRTDPLVGQSSIFLVIALCNLALNNVFMYGFVEHLRLMPVIAQVCTSGLIALWSYFAYSKIFSESTLAKEESKE